MSEDAKGSLPEKQEETDAINNPNVEGDFDDIFADEVQDDDVLDPNDGSTDFETTFDDVSPPVSKKIKTPTDEPSLVPLTNDAKDPIQETVHSSTSDWHNIVADNPRRREIILAM